MEIQAVSHIAVGVRDMDLALGFYRDVLGLRITADKVEEFPQGPGQEPAQAARGVPALGRRPARELHRARPADHPRHQG